MRSATVVRHVNAQEQAARWKAKGAFRMTAAKRNYDAPRYSASGRAASIAQDLERAAAGTDTAFHAARAFGALDNVAYTGPVSAAGAERILRALDRLRPQLLALGQGPEQHVFILAAIESARHKVTNWQQPQRQRYPDRSGSVAADLVRWLAKACDMACCFLEIDGKARLPAAELPGINVHAVPMKRPRR